MHHRMPRIRLSVNINFYKDGTPLAPPSVHHCVHHMWIMNYEWPHLVWSFTCYLYFQIDVHCTIHTFNIVHFFENESKNIKKRLWKKNYFIKQTSETFSFNNAEVIFYFLFSIPLLMLKLFSIFYSFNDAKSMFYLLFL